jgi:putative peptidoglycan lipid II flippase
VTSPPKPGRSGVGAALIAAGIFLSRVAGFAREAVFAWALGSSDAADAFRAALRIPNFLQNLFGEGALSASFIPVYGPLAERDPAAAARLSGVVLSLLSTITAVLVAGGVFAAPLLVDLLAPGFDGAKRDMTVQLVRILFPGTGLLVVSAWCLGVLNAHERFFVPYVAPVLWNAAIIAALFYGHDVHGYDLARIAAIGAVVGSALQLAVQVPGVVRLSRGLRPSFRASADVREVLQRFVPATLTRGVVQISAFIEEVLASLLPSGTMANIAYAQVVSTLPVSLFGMANAQAQLPGMSSARDRGDLDEVRARVVAGGRRIFYFVLPSAVAFAALGDQIAATLFQRGAFAASDSVIVWSILAAASVGLVASTQGRMLSTTFFAFKDTRTPLWCAIARVGAGTLLGWAFAMQGPALIDIDARNGAAGLALGTSFGGVVELVLLRWGLRRHVVVPGLPGAFVARVVVAGLLAAAAGFGAKVGLRGLEAPVLVTATGALGAYAAVYGAATLALRVEEAQALVGRVLRRRR